jgi:hypothetical protein
VKGVNTAEEAANESTTEEAAHYEDMAEEAANKNGDGNEFVSNMAEEAAHYESVSG